VSVDLAVWEGPQPGGDGEARAVFEKLCARYLDATRSPPTERIADYVSLLLDRYPDLTDNGDDDLPWGSGPLIKNASGRLVYIDMKLNHVFAEGWRYCVETATANDLVAFDPQSGTVAGPDPNTVTVAPPTIAERGGGPAYRWLSLRSWRWPFLRPLLRLFRRFL
jgi:hypothetical protein